MNVSSDFGNWLAGFIDGEGCFTLTAKGASRSIVPAFTLCLRYDDGAIIEEIRDRTGIGVVYWYANSMKDGCRRAPRVEWKVFRRSDVKSLVEILDRYPLRAKKKHDYQCWRAAVVALTTRRRHRGPGRTPHPVQGELIELKREMERRRAVR